MDPTGGILTMGAGLLGGILGYKGQKDTNQANIALGREQMAFQERMSSTAYQRAVEDMKKAGLNPMLAYSQGGASSPVGSMPQINNAVAAGVSSAVQGVSAVQSAQQVLQSKAQIDLLEANAAKVRSETMAQDMNTAKLAADIQLLKDRASSERENVQLKTQQTDRTIAETQLKAIQLAREKDTFSADVARRKAESQLLQLEIPKSQAEAKFYGNVEDLPKYLQMIFQLLRGSNSALSMIRR